MVSFLSGLSVFSLANLFVFVCEKERREDFPVVSVERLCYYSPKIMESNNILFWKLYVSKDNGFGNISPNWKLAFTEEAEMKMRILMIIIIIIGKYVYTVLHFMHRIKNIRMAQ